MFSQSAVSLFTFMFCLLNEYFVVSPLELHKKLVIAYCVLWFQPHIHPSAVTQKDMDECAFTLIIYNI